MTAIVCTYTRGGRGHRLELSTTPSFLAEGGFQATRKQPAYAPGFDMHRISIKFLHNINILLLWEAQNLIMMLVKFELGDLNAVHVHGLLLADFICNFLPNHRIETCLRFLY